MKQCLACWEEIEDQDKVCIHCGSNQDEIKDYLALVLLKQRKKKITIPEKTTALDYVIEVDPSTADSITVDKTAAETGLQPAKPMQTTTYPPTKPMQTTTYQPEKPTWLGSPITSQQTTNNRKQQPSRPQQPSRKTIECPNCSKEVSFLKFCKNCGQQLQQECPECQRINTITSKFCTKCGKPLKETVEK